MIQSNSTVIIYKQERYTTADLRKALKLAKHEEQIIAARELGLSIEQISDDDLKSDVDTAVVRISAIVGAELPKHLLLADTLNEEVKIFLIEFGYGNLTMSEILLAFRLNETVMKYPSGIEVERVDFFGAHFNVSFMSKVLSNYLRIRNIIDGKFKNSIEGY